MTHERLSARRRGYTKRWERARLIYLQRNPLCVRCAAAGKIVAAGVVDHIVPHRGNDLVFWDEANWQALCRPCHDRHKQAQERAPGTDDWHKQRVRRLGFDPSCGVDGWPADPDHPAN